MRRLTLEKLAVVIEADISSLRTDLKKARSEIASLSSKTTASAKKIKTDFADAGSKITASFKKIAAAAAAAFSTKVIVDFGKQCVNAASDLQEVQNVVDTVFGSMSSEINAWAQNAKTQFGLGELSAKKYSSTMGAMLSSMGLASGEMKTMSLNLTALAADMASFYNLSSEVAFDKIRSGISGETEPLKQLGINMSVANLEAYALAQGITKSYQAMTQSEQAILRYNYLMNATKNAQGDFARTSDSWANQVRVLSETLTQLKSNIGALLIQALTPFLQMLNRLAEKLLTVSNGIKSMFGIEQETSGGLSGAADSAGDVSDNLEDANKQAEKLKNTIGGFDELHIISPETNADASDAGSGGMQIENPYEGAFDGVAEQIEGLDEATQKMLDNAISKLKPIADAVKLVKDTWATAWNSGNGEQVISSFKGYLNSLLDTIHNIGVAFQEAWNSDNTGVDFINTIQQGLANVIGLAQSVQQSIADAFASDSGVEFIQSLISGFGMLVDIVSAFAEGLRAAWDRGGAGTELIQGMMDGFSAVYELITSIGEAIAEAFRNEHGQAMFSSLIALGETLFGIVESIADAFRAAWEESGLGQNILNNIADIVTNLVEGARQLGENFRAAWESNELGQQIIETLLSAFNGILERVKEMAAAFREWASGVDFEPLLESVLNLAEAFGELAGVIVDKLAGVFESVLLPLAEWSIEEGLPALINAFAAALEAVAAVLDKIPPEVLAAIAAGFLAIKAAIMGFNAIAAVVQTVQTFVSVLRMILPSITPASTGLSTLSSAFSSLGAAISGVSFAGVATAIAGIGAALLAVAPFFIDFETAWGHMVETLQQGVESVKNIPSDIAASFQTGAVINTTMFDALNVAMQGSVTQAQTTSQSMGSAFQMFRDRTKQIFDGVKSDADSALNEMPPKTQDAASKMGDAFKVFRDRTKDMLDKAKGDAETTSEEMGGAFEDFKSRTSELFEGLNTDAEKSFSDMASNSKKSASEMQSAYETAVGRIKQTIGGLSPGTGTILGNLSASSASSASTMSLAAPSLPELAGGGILRKATAVVAGEYPGAATNPEIVAPQKLLQQIIAKSNETMASDIVSGLAGVLTQQQEQGAQELKTKLSGDDILFVVEKAKKRRGATLSNNFAFGGIG